MELAPDERVEAGLATRWTRKLAVVADRRLLIVGSDAYETIAVPWSAVRASALEDASVALMLDDGPLQVDDLKPRERAADLFASIRSKVASP